MSNRPPTGAPTPSSTTPGTAPGDRPEHEHVHRRPCRCPTRSWTGSSPACTTTRTRARRAPARRRRHGPHPAPWATRGHRRRRRRAARACGTRATASGSRCSPTRTVPDYRLEVTYDGPPRTVDDPYRFLPTLGEIDLHLIGEGRHEQLWHVLGAHVRAYDGIAGHGDRHVVRGLGAQRPGRAGERRLQLLGRPRPPDALAGLDRRVGAVRPRHRRRHALQVRGPRRGRRVARRRPTRWPSAPRSRRPPRRSSSRPAYEWGDDDWLRERAPRRDPHAAPMSIYEVHLGSWRQGLSYRELADQLVEHVTYLGFTHVELLPVAEHPFGGSWGYQVSVLLRARPRASAPRTTSATSSTRCTRPASASSSTGSRPTSPRTPGRSPASTAPRSTSTPTRAAASSRTGARFVFDFGRTEVRNFLVANALYWLEEFHIDGLRVDAVASMLYLDYSREEGEWVPNEFGGRENLEAVAFLQEMNATAYRRVPGIDHDRRGVDRLAGCHPAHAPRRARLRLQVEHGLDARLAGLRGQRADLPAVPPPPDDVLDGVRLLRELRAADQPRRGRARQGLAAAQDARRPLAAAGQPARLPRASCGRTPASSCSSWAPSSARSRSGPRRGRWTGGCSTTPTTAASQTLVRDLNRVYRETPALWSRDTDPAGFGWIDANDASSNVFSFLRFGADGSVLACVANFAGDPARGLPARPAARRALGRGAQHRRRGLRRQRRRQPRRRRGAAARRWHGQPASATLRVPPLGTIWLRRQA